MKALPLVVDLTSVRGGFTLEAHFTTDGPVTAVFGPSGAGKTTLLDLIAGLGRPDRGSLRLGDELFVDTAQGVFVPPERRRIGYVFQQPRLFPHLRVRDNLRYGQRTRRGPSAALDTVVELLDIGALLSRWPATLSGGEAQRVALGRAVLSAPRLLLCDEPLNAVELPLRQSILETIGKLLEALELPTLYVSHSLEELLQLTRQFVVLREGSVVANGNWEPDSQLSQFSSLPHSTFPGHASGIE